MDYKKIGLKSGIEIHQQLEGKKLFCDCPTTIREDVPDIEVKRRLKAVVGETGEIDAAAAKEFAKGKYNVYQAYSDTTCLVELDEEPPHLMNEGALHIALELCKRLNCKIVDEVQIMRKTVIDGSNTSGFQRTSLVGYNGAFELSDGTKVTIPNLCIEEDAAKIVSRDNKSDTYNLSRLGIPLVEIATGPDLKTPLEIKEAAEKIGMFLRSASTYKDESVKRGLGTIRQDVNISIKGGNRVEIKGAQDLKMIPTLADYEILRQQKLIELKERNLKIKVGEKVDITELLKETKCKFVNKTIKDGGSVQAIKVEKFEGILGEDTMPGRRVGSEISDYAKQAGVGGIIHSDEELSKYKFSDEEIELIKNALKVKAKDAFIIVADDVGKTLNALDYAKARLEMIPKGVIKEVRKANANGTTSYMRPMPGGARMYPETDTLPMNVSHMEVELGETIEERAGRLVKEGIKDKDVAMKISKEYYDLYSYVIDKVKLDSNTIASNIVSGASVLINKEVVAEVFEAMVDGKIPKNSYLEVLEKVASGKNLEEVLASKQTLPKEELEKMADKVMNENPGAPMGLLMGRVMAVAKGKADGKVVSEILKSKLK